ncbi:MAG TPA: hypothetical protein VIJ85_01945 [Rhizomicrobium sp.]
MSQADLRSTTSKLHRALPDPVRKKVTTVKPNADRARAALPASIRDVAQRGTVPNVINDPLAYGSIVQGNCLAPVICDGDVALFSPSLKVKTGMFVGIFFKNGHRWVKRLTSKPPTPMRPRSNCRVLMRVEMTNPPETFFCDPDAIESLHAIAGVFRNGVFTSLNDRAGRSKAA